MSNNLDYIKFRISQSTRNTDDTYKMATVKQVESSLTDNKDYQYCIGDIIRHALARTKPTTIEEERFTYTFPFTLS